MRTRLTNPLTGWKSHSWRRAPSFGLVYRRLRVRRWGGHGWFPSVESGASDSSTT